MTEAFKQMLVKAQEPVDVNSYKEVNAYRKLLQSIKLEAHAERKAVLESHRNSKKK